jgi:hypothetical protein
LSSASDAYLVAAQRTATRPNRTEPNQTKPKPFHRTRRAGRGDVSGAEPSTKAERA